MLSKHKVLLALLITAWLFGTSAAQESSHSIRPITQKGSAAMEFDFGGLDNLSMPGVLLASFLFPGEGTTDAIPLYSAGAKYYLSDELALRAMVGFSTKTSGADTLSKGKTTGTLYGIGAGIEMHTHAVYAISPYFGAEIIFASGSSDNTITSAVGVAGGKINTLATLTTETKYSATGFGVAVLAGFDWYVFNAVALGCEYSLGFNSASANSTTDSKKTDLPSSTSFGIGSANVHLLIHF